VKSSSTQQLQIHEWLAVILITALLFSLGALAYLNRETNNLPQLFQEAFIPEIEVIVEGAVENGGKFIVKKGMTLRDLLPELQLSENVDLSELALDRPLRNHQKVKIATNSLQITLQGAVTHPGILEVKKGTRVNQLKTLVETTEEADLTVLKSRRKLKDGEVITIPAKY
jgi:hypothetical protein